MTDLGRTLAVIPARGGSTRIPRKNLRTVAGKPLIAHAISQTADAERIDRTIVSTDDEEIASVAREYGGDVPFLRPGELATDTAPTAGVIAHALDWLAEQGDVYGTVCLIQTTTPLRTPDDIDGALSRLAESGAASVISISEYVTAPHWALDSDEDGFLSEYFDQDVLWTDTPNRTQDLPSLKHPNGAVFAAPVETWREHESFYTERTVGYEMSRIRSFDVDEPWELELVRSIANSLEL